MSALALLAALSLSACSGTDPGADFIPAEICDNGIDDNGNGLVDCDDSAFCGGAPCLRQGGTGDTSGGGEPLVIGYQDKMCDFLFSEADCVQQICSIPVENNTDEDGVITANCENPAKDNYEVVVKFRNVQENTGRLNALSASPFEKESSTTIELFYDCFQLETFTTACTIQLDADDRQEDVDFTIEGIFIP